jgi:hypothetical protein
MLRIRITLTTKWKLSESDSDNIDDTSSEEGDEYDSWAPLKAEATQQSLSEFEELAQNFTAEGLTKTKLKARHTYLSYQNFVKIYRIFIWNVYYG